MEQRSPVSRDTATPRAQAAIGVSLEGPPPHATTVASVTLVAAPTARPAPLPSQWKRRGRCLHASPDPETHRRAAKTVPQATAITERTRGALEEAMA